MCGICGIVHFDGSPIDLSHLEAMTGTLRHRGPDETGHFVSGARTGVEPAGLIDGGISEAASVGLGHARLSIIDLSGGSQPMVSPDGRLVIVYNGETYNFPKLRSDLEAKGHRFSTRSDTEVVLHLYQEHGRRCVDLMRGMFAFVVWDGHKRRLFAARDRAGQKPFFYLFDGKRFIFGSEPRALLACPGLKREADVEALGLYLTYGYVPSPRSIFSGVQKLRPAHRMTVSSRGLDLERYWRLSYTPGPISRTEEAVEALDERLSEAVRLRLISDVPLGAFLSGGIDSSAVVAFMAADSARRVKTFSIGFKEQDFNETPYARMVAEQLGTDHTELFVRPDAVSILPLLAWHYGEPFGDSSAVPTYYVSRLTREHVTVALNGDGGDESLAGYERYLAMVLASKLGLLPAIMNRGLAGLAKLAQRAVGGSDRGRLGYAAKFFGSVAGQRDPWRRYLQWVGFFWGDQLARLLTPQARGAIMGGDPFSYFAELVGRDDAADVLSRTLDLDVRSYLPEDLLVKVDIASMAVSLEARSPFLDHRVMELLASLPPSLKLRGMTGKYILKRLMKGRLPDQVIARRKKGFGVPVGDWFKGKLNSHLREVVLSKRALERGWFERAELIRLIKRHESGREDHTERLWALLFLEHWARVYLDGPPPLSPPSLLEK